MEEAAPSAIQSPPPEVWRCFVSLALSLSLSLPSPLSLSLSPSRPWSVSSSGPTYRSASCEVRPSHYIPLGRLRGVYTVEASSVTARSVRRGRVREGGRRGVRDSGCTEGEETRFASLSSIVRLPRVLVFFPLFLRRSSETQKETIGEGKRRRERGANDRDEEGWKVMDGGWRGKCVLDRGVEKCRNPH